MILAALNAVDLTVIGGLITAISGAFYTVSRFSGDKRGGRIEQDRFYKEVYDDLNKTLWTTVREQREEIDRLEALVETQRRRLEKEPRPQGFGDVQ